MLLLSKAFGSSKVPQPPLPTLIVHIDGPSGKVYRPNDLVTGHVSFVPVVPIIPQAIEVTLFGQSRIWHRTKSSNANNNADYYHWRDNAPLFQVSTNVFPQSNQNGAPCEPRQRYSYAFSFRFPAATGNSRVGQYKAGNGQAFTTGTHTLPPSFLITTRKDGSDDSPNYAKIEYGVRATLICPGVGTVQGKTIQNLQMTVPVLFVQPVNMRTMNGEFNMLQHRKTFNLQTSTLSGQNPNSSGFRQIMRDRFSSSTPKVEFESILEMPELLASGYEFRFRAFFQMPSKTENVSYIPSIRFTILKLDLLEFTFVRAPQDKQAINQMNGHHRGNKYVSMPPPDAPYSGRQRDDFTERKTHLNSLPEATTLDLVEVPSGEDKKQMNQADSCEAWFTARVPGFTAPSFKSFAITRAYRVKVKLGIEIAGKKFEHEAEGEVHDLCSAPA